MIFFVMLRSYLSKKTYSLIKNFRIKFELIFILLLKQKCIY